METKLIPAIKFRKRFISNATNKASVHYSVDGHISGKLCVTVYEHGYGNNLRSIFANAENKSDSRSDYFETDKVRFFEGDTFYAEARSAAISARRSD